MTSVTYLSSETIKLVCVKGKRFICLASHVKAQVFFRDGDQVQFLLHAKQSSIYKRYAHVITQRPLYLQVCSHWVTGLTVSGR